MHRLIAVLLVAVPICQAATASYDLIIRNGHIIDGTGSLLRDRIEKARAQGVDAAADTYAYTAWSNSLAAFTPPWANDGGKEQLLRRLKDPAARSRMRRDMMTPSDKWDNEWLEIEGPQVAQSTIASCSPTGASVSAKSRPNGTRTPSTRSSTF